MVRQISRHLRHKIKHNDSLSVVHTFPQLCVLLEKFKASFLSYINYSKTAYHLPVPCSILNKHIHICVCVVTQTCFLNIWLKKDAANLFETEQEKGKLRFMILWFADGVHIRCSVTSVINILQKTYVKQHYWKITYKKTGVSGGKHKEQIRRKEQTCKNKEFHKLHKVLMFYTETA